jgi:hypothetical protein
MSVYKMLGNRIVTVPCLLVSELALIFFSFLFNDDHISMVMTDDMRMSKMHASILHIEIIVSTRYDLYDYATPETL